MSFTAAIRADEQPHRRLREVAGYQFLGSVPRWRNPPARRDDMPLLDLEELHISIVEA